MNVSVYVYSFNFIIAVFSSFQYESPHAAPAAAVSNQLHLHRFIKWLSFWISWYHYHWLTFQSSNDSVLIMSCKIGLTGMTCSYFHFTLNQILLLCLETDPQSSISRKETASRSFTSQTPLLCSGYFNTFTNIATLNQWIKFW